MELGIFAKTFSRPTLEAALDAVVATGLPAMQFNLSLLGGPSLPPEVSAEEAGRVRTAVAARGLRMSAVSGTYNMAHPDAGERDDGRRRLAALIAAAPALGTSVVTLCTGTRDRDDMWRAHPDNTTPGAWRDMMASLGAALEVAEEHGVTLGFEPEHNNVVASAMDGRRLLDEARSLHLKVVIDAANLLTSTAAAEQCRVLVEAFELLGDELVLAHAKDVRADGTVVAAGQGDLDYELYVSQLEQAGFDGDLVLHGLGEDEVAAGVAHVRAALRHRGAA
jgi:sugar phosphate isomerase/epimerase